MAYDYNKLKKQYEGLNDEQKQQFQDMNKNDTSGNFQKFMDQYNAEQNQTPTTPEQPKQETPKATYNEKSGYYETPTVQKTENAQVSPDLDQSKFGEAPGQITVKEGTAKDTGKPDYQISTDARLNEMKSNLDQYFATSPRMFQDRATFNKMFQYNERESEAQKQLLDSYWKRKEDMDRASQYTSGESINNGLKNGQITTDQLNLIKEYDPEAYRKWQQLQEEEIQKRIVNGIVPPLMSDIATQIQEMINNLGIQAQDALDIEGIYNDTMERVGAYQTLQDANNTVKQIEAVNNKITSITSRYAASTGGTVSDALAAARMQKALAPYQQQMQGLQYQYQDYANLYSQKLATANQAAQVRQAQAQENQRVWNQRLTALGFAMQASSYRTPEQQAQLQLQTAQIQNDINLLNQSKQNDLALYNQKQLNQLNLEYQADLFRQQNKLQSELTDLSVEDPAQLRANLNNVLSGYYQQYGDLIQRSQSQAVDDIIKYAEDNNITVAEALTQNFIKQLQNKPEYKNKLSENYLMNKYTPKYSYTIDELGNIVIKGEGYGNIPDSAFTKNRADRQDAFGDVFDYSPSWSSYIENLATEIKDGSYGGQCGAFCNDVLIGGDNSKVFGDSLQDKINACNVKKEEGPQVGYGVVFDLGFSSKDGINHGHVGFVSAVNGDGSIDVLESNGQSDETIHVKRYTKSEVDRMVMGYYKPSNYDISRDLGKEDMRQFNNLNNKFGNDITWNEEGYIESLSKDFESYLDKGKDAITDAQWKALKEDYGMDEKEFREMAQIYAKTGLKKKGVAQAEKALNSALVLKSMIEDSTTAGWKDSPQGGLVDRALQIVPRSSAGEAKDQYKTLLSQLELNELYIAKDNGATFGAMSQSEWDILGQSSTNLKWNSSSKTFNTNLDNLINELVNVVSSGGGKLPDGVYNLDI